MTNVKAPQTSNDSRKVVRGVDEDGNLIFQQLGVEELDSTGRFGARATSSTENTVSIGQHSFTLDLEDDENLFRIGDSILVRCLTDSQCFFWGEIIGKSSSPTVLTVYVDDISNYVLTDANWELQVVGRPQFGITKDTSTTSIDPTGSGPFTFTVTAGKFLPVGGKLLMIPPAARDIVLIGLVKAYSGTSLVVEKNSTNATGSTSYNAWAIALLDAPQNKIPSQQMNGLRCLPFDGGPSIEFRVGQGSMRDAADQVDLVLPADLDKVMSLTWGSGSGNGGAMVVAGAGTVSCTGSTVTGVGTAFNTFFKDAVDGEGTPRNPIISFGGKSYVVTAVASDTSLTIADTASASGVSYTRGGVLPSAVASITSSASIVYDGYLVRFSNGTHDVVYSAATPSGVPDLPSDVTHYAWLGFVIVSSRGFQLSQPLLLSAFKASDILWDKNSPTSWASPQSVLSVLDNHLNETSGAHAASAISVAPTGNISSADVQSALAELDTEKLAATSYTAADVLSKIKTVDGSGSGLDADTLDGHDTSFFQAASGYTAADVLSKLLTVDGSGSGLDADTLDGHDSAFFATASDLSAHIADTSAAHAASAISVTPTGNIASTDAQSALAELDTEKASASDVTTLQGLVNSKQLDGGTYTPGQFTNVNLDAVPTFTGSAKYLRVGGEVFVWFRASVNPTTGAGTTTSFNIDLPINPASTFTGVGQAIGNATLRGTTASGGAHIEAVVGTRRVKIEWDANNTAAQICAGSFSYDL